MNKGEFTNYIAEHNNITKVEAEKIINVFTKSVINILGEGGSISLVRFGNFTVNAIPAREGRNPKNNEPITVPAHNRPKFTASKILKNACNKHNKSNGKSNGKGDSKQTSVKKKVSSKTSTKAKPKK